MVGDHLRQPMLKPKSNKPFNPLVQRKQARHRRQQQLSALLHFKQRCHPNRSQHCASNKIRSRRKTHAPSTPIPANQYAGSYANQPTSQSSTQSQTGGNRSLQASESHRLWSAAMVDGNDLRSNRQACKSSRSFYALNRCPRFDLPRLCLSAPIRDPCCECQQTFTGCSRYMKRCRTRGA